MKERDAAAGPGRRLGLLLVSLLAAALVAACASPPVPTATVVQQRAGTLRVALGLEPQSLNPNLRVDDGAYNVAQSVYNKLVTLDADYRVIPDLARDWDVSADGLTYTFDLAEGVTWHDGRPFSSADVKWTLEQIINGDGVARSRLTAIDRVETPDEHTVVLVLKHMSAPLLTNLAFYGTFILPEHIYAGTDWTANPANEAPVGTGPFRFEEWQKGRRIVLQANAEYFRHGPYLDGVVYLYFPDAAAVQEALIQGEIDYSQKRLPLSELQELGEKPGVRVQTFPRPARYYVAFNLRREPLGDLRVRRAVNMAIDRAGVVNRALAGFGSPAYGLYTPAIPWAYNPDARVPAHDPAGAASLLDQAGLPREGDGARFTVSLVHPAESPYSELAQVLREQLGRVGIDVSVVALQTAEARPRVFVDHDFDLVLLNGTFGPGPEILHVRFGSDGPVQVMGYNNPELDALLDRGARTVDRDRRAQIYHQAQAILARDLPIAPLAENASVEVFRENVFGLPRLEGRGNVTFQDYSLVRLQ